MDLPTTSDQSLVLAVADGWDRLRSRLDGGLNHVVGISFAEYRLLRAIAVAPGGRASRVDLADATSLSPSGVTRALRPLEKLGFVESQRAERDARLALAALTAQGRELVRNASAVVDDVAAAIIEQARVSAADRDRLVTTLGALLP